MRIVINVIKIKEDIYRTQSSEDDNYNSSGFYEINGIITAHYNKFQGRTLFQGKIYTERLNKKQYFL